MFNQQQKSIRVLERKKLIKFGAFVLFLLLLGESAVLYNPQRETHEERQAISKLVSHSISKQWYKKADTFKWWPSYWVSEGIATSYQLDILTKLEPSWRLSEQFLIQELAETLEYDVGTNAVSLQLSDQATPDTLSKYHYIKSFALVRMFSHLPLPGDILENSENPIAVSWTQKAGYPVLGVTRNAVNVLTFTQNNANLRSVPISVAFEDQTDGSQDEFALILEQGTQQLDVSSHAAASWYIVNGDRLGYFRTNYDLANWNSIATFLLNPGSDISKISPANRALLIDDAFNFAKSGLFSFNVYLELTRYLTRENNFLPVYSFIKTANELNALLAKTTVQEQFRQYVRNLLNHLYDELGISITPNEAPLNTLNRIQVLTALCSFGLERCQQDMHAILSTATVGSVVPDLQEPVFCGGLRRGNLTYFMKLLEEYNTHKKKRTLKSMACTSDIDLILSNYILAVIDESTVIRLDPGHKLDAFNAILDGSDVTVDLGLDFVKQHLEQILVRFTDEEISSIFIALSKKLVTAEQEAKIDAIIACLDDAQKVTYGPLFVNVKQNVQRNIEWQNTNVEVIKTWIERVTTTTTPKPSPGSATAFTISSFTLFAYLLVHFAMH